MKNLDFDWQTNEFMLYCGHPGTGDPTPHIPNLPVGAPLPQCPFCTLCHSVKNKKSGSFDIRGIEKHKWM